MVAGVCGLNVIFAYGRGAARPQRAELVATRDAMSRRGPDGHGEWWSSHGRIGLGHRRLSILDLSDRSSQPMQSACGRYVISFNGEIYNYQSLRRSLEAEGRTFRTTSDTEVILHLYARDGEHVAGQLRGMFAFAIWDNQHNTLFAARDPYGIKPLYVADDGLTVRMASQVKALLAGGQISREPEPAGIAGFFIWGSVPEPFTLFRAIRAVPAGHWIRYSHLGSQSSRYSSIPGILSHGETHLVPAKEITERIREAALDTVTAHMVADVEVGVFLSAGVDSSAILGLMRDASPGKVRAITLQFDEFVGRNEDEVPLAREVSQKYGAEHTVRVVSRSEFEADLPDILAAMDQPSIDGINTWFVAKAAREAGLKVALSGLGGDEILAGYPSFVDVPRWVSMLRMPGSIPGLRAAASATLHLLGISRRFPKSVGMLEYGGSYEGAYLLRRCLLLPEELATVIDPELAEIGLQRLQPLQLLAESTAPNPVTPISRVAALESTAYLRNQLLRDADWAGMAHSLEVRTPLVDISFLKAMSSITPVLATGQGKNALAGAPRDPVPQAVLDRRKTGFCVPTGHWLPRTTSQTVASRGIASRMWANEVFAAQQTALY